MVALAATKEEVVERLKIDVYNANGVWDLSKVCRTLQDSEMPHADEILNLGPNLPLQVVPVKTPALDFFHRNIIGYDGKELESAL